MPVLYRYKCSRTYGFKPSAPHEQWHTDTLYLWVKNRWYFFVGMLDAYSRNLVHWELLESLSGADVRAVLHTALKKHPGQHPGLVSENGVQFKDQDNLKRYYEDNEEEQLGVLPPPRIYRFQATDGARVPSQDCPTLRW